MLATAYGAPAARSSRPAASTVDTADHRMPRSPSTVRVTGGGGDDLAGEPAVLGVELDDGVHVGRRTSDVDDDDVAGTGVLVVEPAGQQLDAGQHDVGRRAADEVGEGRPRASARLLRCLPPITWRQEHLADRRPRAAGCEHADPRHDVVGQDVRGAARARVAATSVCASTLPATTTGRSQPSAANASAALDRRLGVAAVGAAGEQHDVGLGLVQGLAVEAAVRHREHGHDLAAARQRDPAPGLGGDELLVADHRDPQAAAGAGAGEHVGVAGGGVLLGQGGQAGVVPVEDVAAAVRPGSVVAWLAVAWSAPCRGRRGPPW